MKATPKRTNVLQFHLNEECRNRQIHRNKKWDRRLRRTILTMEVQWLRFHTSTVGGLGSIPGWGTKIPRALQNSLKKKKKVGQRLPRAERRRDGGVII